MLVAVLAFVMLTRLDGRPVWVDNTPGVVQIIQEATDACHKQGGSGLQIGARTLCVRETPAEIQEKLNAPKR